MLTGAQKKMLTEKVLHKPWFPIEGDIVTPKRHLKRGEIRNRSFATDQDVLDLMRALVEKGEWGEFMRWVCYESNKHDWGVKKDNYYYYDAGFIAWLFLSTDEDGTRTFCRLCAEWWEKERKG